MRILVTVLLALASGLPVLAQPDSLWSVALPLPGDQYDNYLCLSDDGSAYVVMNTIGATNGLSVVHIAPDSELLFDTFLPHSFSLTHAAVRYDNSLLLVGHNPNSFDVYLLDGDTGAPLDSVDMPTYETTYFFDLYVLPDESSYVLGQHAGIRLWKLDPELAVEWSLHLPQASAARDLVLAPDGGCVAGGENYDWGHRVYLHRVAPDGTLLWEVMLSPFAGGQAYDYQFEDMTTTPGGFLIELRYEDHPDDMSEVFRYSWSGELLERVLIPNESLGLDRMTVAPDGTWLVYDRAGDGRLQGMTSNGVLEWSGRWAPIPNEDVLYQVELDGGRRPWVTGVYIDPDDGGRNMYISRLEQMPDAHVFVHLFPVNLEPFPPEGGYLRTTAQLISERNTVVQGQAWIGYRFPDGSLHHFDTVNLALPPHAVIDVQQRTLPVPGFLPPGDYEFIVALGQFPNVVAAADSIHFHKIEPERD